MTRSVSSDTQPEPLLDLQRLVAGVRWRRRTLAATALLGLVLGVLFTLFLPSRSTAVTRIYVVHEDEQSGDRESLMETDLAVLGTTTISAAAVRRLGLDVRPEDFVAEYSGTTQAANVLEIGTRGGTDAEAVARARAVADSFIAEHVDRSQKVASAEAEALLDRRADVVAELAKVDSDIATASAPGAPATLVAQIETFYGRRSSLASDISELDRRAEEAGIGAPRVAAGTQIIDAPHAMTRALPVAAAINGGIGLVLGLGLGLALAAVASVARDRPVLRRDIAAHLGASVIAQLPRPSRGLRRLLRRSRAADERTRAAATLVRAVRDGEGGVSLLELGCADTAAALAVDMADLLGQDRPVVVVDDLPGGRVAALVARRAGSAVTVVDGSDDLDASRTPRVTTAGPERRIGVGTVVAGASWTDLRRLGSETLLVVRAGSADTDWLHTVARQLADSRIAVVGVVLVHPDPRDRSDGTLWDALNTALRGRGLPVPEAPAAPVAALDEARSADLARRAATVVPNARNPTAPVPDVSVPDVSGPDVSGPDVSGPALRMPRLPATLLLSGAPVTRSVNGHADGVTTGDAETSTTADRPGERTGVTPSAARNGSAMSHDGRGAGVAHGNPRPRPRPSSTPVRRVADRSPAPPQGPSPSTISGPTAGG